MSENGNKKKDTQLGMAHGTANNKLRKLLLFKYVTKCGENICFRCGGIIDNIDNFSIDHKQAWLNSEDPVGLYFSLDNIAFSHLDCNVNESKVGRPHPRPVNHGRTLYSRGCRCEVCCEARKKDNEQRFKENGDLRVRFKH
jgi:hypothetical protein